MKLNANLMLKLLKEEYDKRIDYYLGEVETRAKHSKSDGELVKDAEGLKVKDRAGFMFVIKKIEAGEDGKLYVYLLPPGIGDEELSRSDFRSREEDDVVMHDDFSSDYDYGEEDYIYSSVRESDEENQKQRDEKEGSSKKKLKAKKDSLSGDIIKPSPKAQFKKQSTPDVDAETEDYEEVGGLVKITLDQLEKDFTL